MRPIIHSQKHVIQLPLNGITTATREQNLLVDGVAVADKTAATEVVEGATVKAVYIELWLQNSSTLGESIVTVTKVQEGGNGPTFTEMAALNDYTNKKNVLFTHQGLTANDGVSGPLPVPIGWVKIPKGKQRFGLGDRLWLSISNVSSNNLNRCGLSIYKEYT